MAICITDTEMVAGRSGRSLRQGCGRQLPVSSDCSQEPARSATKFWSFSLNAQSLATHRSSLSRHQPTYCGSPPGAAGVGVLDLDEPVAPAGWQGRRLEVDAVDAEAVEFFKWGELAGDSFDEVGEARSLVVVISDGEDIDLDGHGRRVRQLVLTEGTENGLRADDDYFPPSDDLAGSADRVLKLIASHQLAHWSTA